jgi:hypothetical protein
LLNLDRTDIKVLRQLDQGPLALDLGYSDFRLEGRACGSGGVVLPWSSLRSRQSCRRCAENPLIPAVQFSRRTFFYIILRIPKPADRYRLDHQYALVIVRLLIAI